MNKVLRAMIIVLCFEMGALLLYLPWSSFWERNYFALAWPPLRLVLTNNFVRGAVCGLGVVNLCAGFADLALMFAAREPENTVHDGVGQQ